MLFDDTINCVSPDWAQVSRCLWSWHRKKGGFVCIVYPYFVASRSILPHCRPWLRKTVVDIFVWWFLQLFV